MARKLVVVFILVVLVAALFLFAKPFLVTNTTALFATEDTYVSSQSLSSSFGTAATLVVRNIQSGANSFQNRTWIRFDFAALGVVEQVQSATLRLTVVSCNLIITGSEVSTFRVTTYTMTAGWTESSTWLQIEGNNLIAETFRVTVAPASCPSPFTRFTVTADVTSAVQSWVVSGTVNNGFRLYMTDEFVLPAGDETRWSFSSREGGTPELDIIYTSPSAGQGTGVGPGTNQTQNKTTPSPPPPAASPLIPFAAAAFVFLLIAVPLRRHPLIAVVVSVAASVLVFFIVRGLLGGG